MVPARMIPTLLISYGLVGLSATAQTTPKSLSLRDAITTALENNLQVKIARVSQEQSYYGIQSSLGAYDWKLTGQLNLSRSIQDKSVTEEVTAGNRNRIESTGFGLGKSLTVGLNKPFDWGGAFDFSYNPAFNYASTTAVVTPVDPAGPPYDRSSNTRIPYSGSWNMSYNQSLLRNFGRDVAGADLLISRKNAESADLNFQAKVIQFVADTESQYWDAVYALRNLENKKLALALAQKQLKENEIRVEVGTMAPIEVVSAQAAVAQQEQAIIAAEAAVANATDTLLRAIYPEQERPSDLVLTDAPTVTPVQVDEASVEKTAMDNRIELKIARINIETSKINEHVAVQNRLPQLDARVGVSSTANYRDSLSGVNQDLAKRTKPNYSLGLTFSMPIQNRSALANLSTRRAQTRSSELSLKDTELTVKLGVRTALRNLKAAEKGVLAAQRSREFSEADVNAEQKKFENGMSTNFTVLSKQSSLDAARASELQAQVTYVKAVTAFDQALGRLLEARKLSIK